MKSLNDQFLYAVKIKRAAGWQDHDTARLQISVGQEYHEGEKLAATIQWVKKHFDHTIICVNDTLQRHNFEFDGMDSIDAYHRSEEAGREWIERNIDLLRAAPDATIYRWDQWYKTPEYHQHRLAVDEYYQTSKNFQKIVGNETEGFWKRRQGREELCNVHKERFRLHTREYLLEECAVFRMMFAQKRAADIYPGSTLLPCTVFKPDNGGSKHAFTRIDFSKRDCRAEFLTLDHS